MTCLLEMYDRVATSWLTPVLDFFMPRLLYVESSIWPIPLAVEIGFSALGFQADSFPINLVKHEYCSLFSNSLATSFADTCIRGGLSVYTTGTAGVGVFTCNNKTAINTHNPPITVSFLIGILLGYLNRFCHYLPLSRRLPFIVVCRRFGTLLDRLNDIVSKNLKWPQI